MGIITHPLLESTTRLETSELFSICFAWRDLPIVKCMGLFQQLKHFFVTIGSVPRCLYCYGCYGCAYPLGS